MLIKHSNVNTMIFFFICFLFLMVIKKIFVFNDDVILTGPGKEYSD